MQIARLQMMNEGFHIPIHTDNMVCEGNKGWEGDASLLTSWRGGLIICNK